MMVHVCTLIHTFVSCVMSRIRDILLGSGDSPWEYHSAVAWTIRWCIQGDTFWREGGRGGDEGEREGRREGGGG